MKINEIIYSDEIICSDVPENQEFDNITTDILQANSRSVVIISNSLNMPNLNSFDIAPTALICDQNAVLPQNIRAIRVKNPRLALAKAYYRYYHINTSGIKMIAVTGTNGKTSTAEFIKTILTKCGYKTGFIGTGKIEINGKVISDSYYSMTTPDPSVLYPTISLMINEGCNAIIMEASSHALALDKLAPLKFDYGIFTNLSAEHLDFHKSIEEYYNAKLKLFKSCDCGIFNIDDQYARKAYNDFTSRKISIGILWRGDIWATNIENRGFGGIGYMYQTKKFNFHASLKTAGIYNTYNSMLAATVCIDMGCRPCEVKSILSQIDNIPGRYEIINGKISVIIDYAHTDFAFENIIKELASVKGNNKLTTVFGCGGNRDRQKRPKMATIAERFSDRVIVTTDNSRKEDPKDIISDIIRGFKKGCYEVIEDRKTAIRTAILSANDGDIVAIIGKGCEKYNIDSNGYSDFCEKDIVTNALCEREDQENENQA